MDLAGPYLRGLAVGFAIAAAIGPIGLLCIRRTLESGGLVGLVSGFGAASADATYAAVAAFGLTAISDALVAQRRPLGLVGGAFLVLLAVRLLRQPTVTLEDRRGRGLLAAYSSTLVLTIANPATILSFAAAFVGFGLLGHGGAQAAVLVVGVLCGSATWWVILAGAASLARSQLGAMGLRRLTAASSGLIAAMGILAIASTIVGG